MNYIAGIDIGGTSVKLGIINTGGELLHKWHIPTNKEAGIKYIVGNIWTSLENKMNQHDINHADMLGIGVGAPGFINMKKGIVDNAVNVGWRDYPLTDELHALSGLPVFLENDANIAALGENWRGAGNNARNVLAITIGTGVGGGVITNGVIFDGANGTAGEIGHVTVDPQGHLCNCGRRGCLETIASATGIARQGMSYQSLHPDSALADLYLKKGDLDAEDVFTLAKQGDEPSKEIVAYTLDILGFVIANAASILNPDKILIGGGVSKAGNMLIEGIQQAFEKYVLPHTAQVCEIKQAKLGNDAGIIGAAFLVHQKVNHAVFNGAENK